jgi:2-keto-3-deoxy-L-rhamnonate aldolase RhmA
LALTLTRLLAAAVFASTVAASARIEAQRRDRPAVIDLWSQGKPAFGVFVPNENPVPRGPGAAGGPGATAVYTRAGGEKLAANPLYDFVFLNLEGGYDAAAVTAIAAGLRASAGGRPKTLLVRIPPIERDGVAAARARVKEALELGADGVTIPHVRNVEEATLAVGFFREAGASVWSPANPGGDTLAMLMIEDPGALEQAQAIAGLGGYSILACGIGSLTAALGGNREAAEAGNQRILSETRRVKLVNMLTASAGDVERRVEEGFLALLAQGRDPDEVIKRGRAAAGR